MAKVAWGNDLAGEIDNWEDEYEGGEYPSYDGPEPAQNQIYRFKITAKKALSSGGFKQLVVRLTLDPHRTEHKKYEGFSFMDFLIVEKNTVFKYAPLIKALGLTGKEFALQTQADTDGEITKIGRLTFPAHVLGRIYKDKKAYDPQYPWKVKYVPGVGELTVSDDDDGAEDVSKGEAPF